MRSRPARGPRRRHRRIRAEVERRRRQIQHARLCRPENRRPENRGGRMRHARMDRHLALPSIRRGENRGILRHSPRKGRGRQKLPQRQKTSRSGGVLRRRRGIQKALRPRRHRPCVHSHPVEVACPYGRIRNGIRQARRARSPRRAHARGGLAAGGGERAVPKALLHARKLRLRLFRGRDNKHGARRRARGNYPRRGRLHTPHRAGSAEKGDLAVGGKSPRRKPVPDPRARAGVTCDVHNARRRL